MTSPPSSSPQSQPQSPYTLWLLLVCIVFVRFFWYEWRPWHSLSLRRELLVWSLALLLYYRLWKRVTRPPLLYYGRVALVQEKYVEKYYHALKKQGLQVAILCDDTDDGNNKKHAKDPTITYVSPQDLSKWLGTQQWNGGVGVFVVDSSSISSECILAVQRHMGFRSSGAMILMEHQGNNDSNAPVARDTHINNTKSGIDYLHVPFYLQSYPGVAEASFKAVHYSRRLRLHNVLIQQFKDLVKSIDNNHQDKQVE